ncbi:MAG: hypothetical protein IGBAC_0237 [Ignavibacteriae bacterium]|nr:MAG: hypothetical protein IGBAC_0237 [Ignavibacteriota bacterium]
MLWLWRSKERGLINEKEYQRIKNELDQLIPQTIKFITQLQQKKI